MENLLLYEKIQLKPNLAPQVYPYYSEKCSLFYHHFGTLKDFR